MTELTKLTLKDTISFCLQLIQLRKKKKSLSLYHYLIDILNVTFPSLNFFSKTTYRPFNCCINKY